MSYRGKYAKCKKSYFKIIIPVVLLVVLAILGIKTARELVNNPPETPAYTPVETQETFSIETTGVETTPTIEPTETIPVETEPPVYTASIGAMGDLLMHKPIFETNTVVYQDGQYNFDSLFEYIKDDINALDYAAINLETTLCGEDNGYPYKGYPRFNCPDELIDSVKDAGFDMVLTANNHSYDTDMVGCKRTIQVVQDYGLETIGTYQSADDSKWTIQTIDNINVGMMCYTYATDKTPDGRAILNGGLEVTEKDVCNYFTYEQLETFYQEVEQYINEMDEANVDATIMFIHWGDEYQLKENYYQRMIAQKLCDLGIDVIIGGHPHVVQPMELLESTVDADHKTVCIYSVGNAVSNQRQGNISAISTAHTEDGVLFSVTFEKIADGNARLVAVDVTPTWVNMFTDSNNKREYNILPLSQATEDSWQAAFDLNDAMYSNAKQSFERTMEIVGPGLQQVQDYINSNLTCDE